MNKRDPQFLVLSMLALCLFAAGCANPGYDPTKLPPPSQDKIAVVSMSSQPYRAMAFGSWQAAMIVKNTGKEKLTDITYTFAIRAEEIGRGTIPSLNPGETAEVRSQEQRKKPGNYCVEGKVFLSKSQEEPLYADRMNNLMALVVTVAQ